MIQIIYRVKMYSYWHIGSGDGGGVYADQICLKDAQGFPYIPGKTMKGLFRDVAESMAQYSVWLDEDFITDVFGIKAESSPGSHTDDSRSVAGKWHFSDVLVPSEMVTALMDEIRQSTKVEAINEGSPHEYLFARMSSTSLKNGVAKDHSLRTIQVTLPIELVGTIESFHSEIGEANALDVFDKLCKGVKFLGAGRTRGLGRCDIRLISAK